MSEMTEADDSDLDPAQAAELSQLVELEARWENLRKPPTQAQQGATGTQDLLAVQKAYDAFRGKLVAYNKRFKPAHVPELLLNTPSRLAAWCRSMRGLWLRVENNPQIQPPAQLLAKAYRLADRLGARLKKDCLPWPAPPATVRAAAQDLEDLGRWCEELWVATERPNPEPTTALGARHANLE